MIPRRHSLLVRLLAMSVVVAGCSIAATAWLAAQSTSGAINREIGESLATDAKIYDSLLGYAATHRDWSGVQQVVSELAEQTGRRITLTTQARQEIASSGSSDTPLPRTPSAVVDPLAVDPVLKPDAAGDGIDARAVGPYRLTEQERARLRALADRQLSCYRSSRVDATLVELPNGRPVVNVADPRQLSVPRATRPGKQSPECVVALPDTDTERKAEHELNALVNACLSRQGLPGEQDNAQLDEQASPPSSPEAERCQDSARREQLAAHVSPAAQLFITQPGTSGAAPGLAAVGISPLVWTGLGVLVLTVGITALAAGHLVRPIDAITTAARRMGDGDRSARVTTKARGEIGDLAATFNAMSAHIERTEEQRKTMVSDIAHELRTPLVNVRGWLEAVQDGVATPDEPLIDSLLEETLLLQRLVDDLQDLALADAGKLRVHPEPLHLATMLDQVVAAHRSRAEASGVTLTANVTGDLSLIADPARMRQALGNLVSNALRYTSAGGSVTVSANAERDQVRIDVTDTGIGIKPEDLPHVFDRFWRAEKSRSRQAGGSGLGLAITHHLVQIHGGRIAVRSTPGVGTTFSLHLPTLAPDLPADA